MDPDQVSEHENHVVENLEVAAAREGVPTSSKKSDSSLSSSSSSSSSDSSFDEDFFQIEDNNLNNSNASNASLPKSDDDSELALKDVEKEFFSDSSPNSGTAGLPELHTSPPNGLVTQSPPVQVMERPEEATPYRIPSSVFASSKSTTPMEWSIASNESLFSIHMGNNSFSRDHIFLMGRSGELGMSGELIFSNNSSPPITAPDPEPSSPDLDADIAVTEAAAETMIEVMRVAAEDKKDKKTQPIEIHRSSSISHRSDGSGASIRSFAFPILTGEGGKSGSVKAEPRPVEKQRSQPKTPPIAPMHSSETKWFPCFSCCCFCC